MLCILEGDSGRLTMESLAGKGSQVVHGTEIPPGGREAERGDCREVVLAGRLGDALARKNPSLPADALDGAFKLLLRPESQVVMTECGPAYQRCTEDVPVQVQDIDGQIRDTWAHLRKVMLPALHRLEVLKDE